MDVVRLGERYTTAYLPDKPIEGYESMIWAERWPLAGDFELSTRKIEETLALLPVDTLISHLDTDDVHIVEDHVIEEDDLGRQLLKVTGSSLTGFINHRYVDGKYGKKRTMARKYTTTSALAVLLWQAFDNASGKDVTRESNEDWSDKDRIVNISITESAADDGNSKNQWLMKGPLGPQIQELLTKGDLGLRMIRPHDSSAGTIITVTVSPLEDRGKVVRTPTTGITSLRFDIYDGVDRTGSVKFRTLHGDMNNVQYLESKKDTKTVAEIMTAGLKIADQYRTGESGFTGIKRRVGTVDVGEPDTPPEPKRPQDPRKNATQSERETYRDALDKWREDHEKWDTKVNGPDGIIAQFREDTLDEAARYLKDTRVVSVLSGDISPLAPYQFKTDYNLGDKVTLMGDYDQTETMIVTEYIRTDDDDGDRGYPGLTMP